LQADGDLVAKLYKSTAAISGEEVLHQFDALARLNGLLHGHRTGAWTICVPRPLRVMDSPPVLLMTRVPGTHIELSETSRAFFRDDVLSSAAGGFAGAMQHLWSRGGCHRDLGLRNILFDPDHKIISLIDAGTSRSCAGCGDPHHGSSAAATDLGHLLYEHASDLSDFAGRRRSHQQAFVEHVLRNAIANQRTLGERHLLLDDIEQSTKAHVDRLLSPGLSMRGAWHLVVKHLAGMRVRGILEQIRADLVDGARAADQVEKFSAAEIRG
jgi:hypothetical protein